LARWLGPFFTVNAGFFMGLFFAVAGYFTPAAFDRKGSERFLSDRFKRLGIPLLVYFLLVSVPISYFLSDIPRDVLPLWGYYLSPWHWDWLTVYMHLWFLGHLFVYACVYALWRQWRGDRPPRPPGAPAGHGALIALVLALAGVSGVVRFEFPQDRWVFVGVPSEVAHLPQYLLLFALGIAAHRTRWLERVPSRVGRIWLGIGLLAAAVMYVRLLRDVVPLPDLFRSGGYGWRTMAFALWEAFLAIGLSAGLAVLFRDKVTAVTRWTHELAASSYTVYIVHIVIVVGLQMPLVDVAVGPTAKFLIVTALAWPLCFLLAGALRRLPGARAVL
jgi:fucose 4-O-acetylase-like acetyltransferase